MDYAEGKYLRDKTHSREASDLQLIRNGQTSQTYLEQSGASIVDGRSINSFIQGVGVGLTHNEFFSFKKPRKIKKINSLKMEQEEPESAFGRISQTKFKKRDENSENNLITDCVSMLSNKTSAICRTADMSFKTRLEADFQRLHQNMDFLFRQREKN